MPRRSDSSDPYAPLTQDSPIAPGDPNLRQYQPVDQAFIDRDPRAAAYARMHDMAGLNNYLHSLGRRLPVFAQEGYDYNVASGKIERTSTPWYKDPALLGAIGLPVAVAAFPALAGASAGGAGGSTAAGLGPSTAANMAATNAVVGGSTVPTSLAAGAGTAGAGVATAKILNTVWGGAADIIDTIIRDKALNQAADTQSAAAERAAQIIAESEQQALDFQKQQYAQSRSDLKPWLAYGTSAVNTLGNLMGLKPADIPDIALTGSGTGTGAYQFPGGPPGVRAPAAGGPPGQPTGGTAIPRPPGSVPPTTGKRSDAADIGSGSALTRTYVPPSTATPRVPTQTGQPPPAQPGARTPPSGIQSTAPQQFSPETGYGANATNADNIMVKWPDGTTTKIPKAQLGRYLSLGAEPVGTGTMQPQQQQPTMGGMY